MVRLEDRVDSLQLLSVAELVMENVKAACLAHFSSMAV